MADDVEKWLEQLGLGQYLDLFAQNDIEWAHLPELDHENLTAIGILSLGHRLSIIKAAAEQPMDTADSGSVVEVVSTPNLPVLDRNQAERRQLTIMFCDLVGSTSLSTKLDPEDLRELMVAYQEATAAEITRYGGHVAKFMGDGVLAYFGWPRADENDAERAVSAGLELTEIIGRQKTPDGTPLACKVGIATGLVVVGDLIGDGAAQEQAVVGETPNLAARLEALAKAGQVIVSSSTRRLLGGLFYLTDLGVHDLKGFERPVKAWQAIGTRSLESRYDARSGDTMPIIGRDNECDLMQDLWTKAKAGEGHVVLVSGEAGVGKSRLTAELRSSASNEPHTTVRYQCSPFHDDSPLHPIVRQIESAADLQAVDSDKIKLEKLEQLLLASSDGVETETPLIASLLSISIIDSTYHRQAMSPQMRKDLTLQALVKQLINLSGQRPVLLLFEDLHWIDPTSLELLERIVEIVSTMPVLLVVTFRPEFRAPWVGQAHVVSITLNRLNSKAGANLIKQITANRSLPKSVEKQILDKTDGVPLFVEELTKTILESDLLVIEDDVYTLAHELPDLAIPETLQDSLMARLDRLDTVKEVAQIGAILGREFSFELIAAISDLDDPQLTVALDQLVDAELIYIRGRPPDAIYVFKHALVQDTAYSSLLKSRRQKLHASVVHTLENDFPQTAEPELIAHHAAVAGQIEKAIAYWYEAAERANIGSANAEGEGHINKALAILDKLPAESRIEVQVKLLIMLGRILGAKNGFGHPDVAQVFSEARKLGETTDDAALVFPAILGLTVYSSVRAELSSGITLCERLIDLATERNDEVWTVQAHYGAGIIYSWRGALKQARHHLELACDHYNVDQHEDHLALYSQDVGPICHCRNAMLLWYLGYPDQALSCMENALNLTEKLGHPLTRNYVLTWAGFLRIHRREIKEALYWNQQALDYANEQKFTYWIAMATAQHGWLMNEQGQVEQGIATIKQGMEQLKRQGSEASQSYSLALLGEALGRKGDVANGIALIEQGLVNIDESKEEWCKAELLRQRGDLALLANPEQPADIELWYGKAIDMAQQESAKSWELRATTSLASLWANRGRQEEAEKLLKPVVAWFKEGHDTPDFKDAETLLRNLQRVT